MDRGRSDGAVPDGGSSNDASEPPAPAILVTPTSVHTSEAGKQDSFQVVLATRPFRPVTLAVSSSDESEATVDVASLEFDSENWDVPQEVIVTGVDDFEFDGDRAFSIKLGPSVSTEPAYHGLDVEDVSGLNADDEKDLCADAECGRGTCQFALGAATCECEPGFQGEHCEGCGRGYTGEHCDACAEGFMRASATGGCVPEPCAGDPCHGHGTCIADGTQAVCRCEQGYDPSLGCASCAEGYAGDNCDSCAAGYSNPDGGGCQLTVCLGVTCKFGGTCEAHGTGPGQCVCPEGHGGADCGTCQAGYAADATGRCVPTTCATIACEFGVCRASATASPTAALPAECICDLGYSGSACDQCADGYVWTGPAGEQTCQNVLPVEAGLHMWFDAADEGTLDMHEQGTVAVWWDKVAQGRGETHPRFYQGNPSRQPALTQGALPGVEFLNGTHLGSNVTGFNLLGEVGEAGDFTIFVVAEWPVPRPAYLQTLLAAYKNGYHNGDAIYKLARTNADFLLYTYRSTFAVEAMDVAQSMSFVSGTRQVIISERRPSLNSFEHVLRSPTQDTVVESTQGDTIASSSVAVLGQRLVTVINADEPFDGTIHEILVYTNALSTEQREQVRAYLNAKWDM